ncbi:hypothetical protein [Streptomyces umbrinus]|uniref:hypothetical protein n=1 Tax=Streptomyces umbrinus TaxID=67370 RepID=UPI003417DF89
MAEASRDERIEEYYHHGARELAEWLVDAEDKLKESDRLREHAGSLYEMFSRLRDEEADRADRFESAWKSARRRASDEHNFGMEALELKRAEIFRLRDEERRLRDFADEVRRVLGFTHVDGNWRDTHMPALYDARHELDTAQRERRDFVPRHIRGGARGDVVEADQVRETTHGPRLETAGDEEDGGTVWRLVDGSVLRS